MMRWIAIVLIVLLAAACTPLAQIKGTDDMLAAQAAREKALAKHQNWVLQGQLGVSDGHDGGSGSLTWTHAGKHFTFVLRAPITGRTLKLVSTPDGATLSGLDRGTVHGADASRLLERVLGWHVPVHALHDWVRGMRMPSKDHPATLRFGENGLPSLLLQDGWKVEYRDWDESRAIPLPRKVYASHGPYRVRLSIHAWQLR